MPPTQLIEDATASRKPMDTKNQPGAAKGRSSKAPTALETTFGCPRNFLENRFVYVVISPRARGLSIGVNMNPDKQCNFDCVYCEINRCLPAPEKNLDVSAMATELEKTLALVRDGELQNQAPYRALPAELLKLRHVALSGDGEPTLSPNFAQAVHAVMHVRARSRLGFYKIVLITNASGLDLPGVQEGLRYFTAQDEIWAKLDGGTQAYLDRVNKTQIPLEKIMANILALAQRRPVVIQSLFPSLNGREPAVLEIEAYAQRLKELTAAGANISLVQIYSATRPTPHSECGHLPLRSLSRIAQQVRAVTGLKAEVF